MSKIIFHQSFLLEDERQIAHGFFQRTGGVSGGAFNFLNCSYVLDEYANILENRKRAAESIGMDGNQVLYVNQVHGNDIIVVDTPWDPHNSPDGDAMVTRLPNIGLGIATADCGPVLLYDPVQKIIGAVHAGWRGALQGIAGKTVNTMITLGSNPQDIKAVLGPCIHQKSLEMGQEVYQQFLDKDSRNEMYFKTISGSYHLDLPGYIIDDLKSAGVIQIEVLPINTYTNSDFYSYRRMCHAETGIRGCQPSIIALKP